MNVDKIKLFHTNKLTVKQVKYNRHINKIDT